MKEEFKRLAPEHKETVLKMVESIWEGEDYTKIVYDQWVQSEKDLFYGLWIDEVLVGIGRMTYLTKRDIWLEGLKKDPSCQIRGIGKRFVDFFFDIIRHEKNLRSIRFSTYFANDESIRLNTKFGFRQTHTFSNLYLEVEDREDPIAGVDEFQGNIDELIDVFEQSSFYRAMDGFITQGWVFYPASKEMLGKFITQGTTLTIQSESGIEGAILISESPKERSMSILMISTEDEVTLQRLLQAVRYRTWQKNIKQLTMMCPDDPKYLNWLKTQGFSSWDRDHDVYVFDFPIEKLTAKTSP